MASAAANPRKRPAAAAAAAAAVTDIEIAEAEKPSQASKDFEPRGYQADVFNVAVQRNTIAVLDTGAGKTMIAVMLIRHAANKLRADCRRLIVFLAPTVPLVNQQYEVISIHTDLDVARYYGAKGVDQWTAECWEKEVADHQVLVMTPQILLDALRNAFITLDRVQLLIFDECHRASGNHPYTRIMKEFYHKSTQRPSVFGMTASPVTRKGVSSATDCEDQLSELERILDSTIYTVADRREMDLFVPASREVNRYFDPNPFVHEGLRVKLETLKSKFDELLSGLEEESFYEYKDADENLKAMRKRLSSSHMKISHCLDDLGLFCANEAAKVCMEAVHLSCSAEGYSFGENLVHYNTFLEEVSHAIEGSLPNDYQSFLKTFGCLEAVQFGYISPKLHELIRIFESFGMSKQVLCLIFVERIITAKVIERFLKTVPHLSHFSVSYLTGGGSSIDSLTLKEQKETLNLFRSGKVNLLFTTDVAEEGLHIPDCACVIRFDLPKTVRSYVQSRGRARQVGSHYILMLERGNIQQRDLLFDIIRSENSMMNIASNRDPDTSISKVCIQENMDVYSVESTGATITLNSSISLVYKYCEKLPRDKYYTPRPVFQFSLYGGSYECTLILPSNAAFQTLVGPLNPNSHVAKQLVCLDACRKLHELGALNNHLLPSIEDLSQIEPTNKLDESASGVGTTKRKELHGTARIHALSGTWAHKKESVTLQAYKIKFLCDQVGQNYSGFVLLIDAILEDDVGCVEMELFLVDKSVKASICPCGPIQLDMEQVEQGRLFQEFFFNGLFGKLFKGSKSSQVPRKFLLEEDNRLPWSSLYMYMLLPLLPSCIQDFGDDIRNNWKAYINWKGINATASVVEFIRNTYSSGVKVSHLSTCNTHEIKCPEINKIYLANKSVEFKSLKDMVVVAIHTGKVYIVLKLVDGSSSESPFDQTSKSSSSAFTSFSEYFNKRYGIVLQHPGQPLLLLKQSHNPHNLLSSRCNEDNSTGKKSCSPIQKSYCYAHMPPELLVHVDVQQDVVKSFYLLPSFMHRIESLMLASQLRKEIPISSGSSYIPSALILEAITTMRCCEDLSMERLELLGDSVLKYAVSCYLFMKFPDKHEGQLSALRSRAVCNATLHKMGIKCNVQGYIRDAAFEPRRWVAPGHLSMHLVPCNCGVDTSKAPMKILYETTDKPIVIGKACDEGHRWICSKTISDCVEALIGAYYVGGGLKSALALLNWFGIEVEFEWELVEEAMRTAAIRSCTPKLDDIETLELKLGYKFSVKGLLLEAITHASQQELGTCYCYQRLEFLGDSALDLLITWHLYTSYKDVDPGDLTDLRSAAVNNKNFAQVAVRHNLQQHLLHASGLLFKQITNFVKTVGESHEDKMFLSHSSSMELKVLGDMVESIAAAVLIDTKLNLDKVWEVFEPLLSPIATPDNLELPPLRQLLELCGHLGYFLNTKVTNEGDKVVAVLEVQLEDVLLAREGCDKNGKAAKGQAAFLLLKDFEERGLSHSQNSLKRRKHEEKSVNDSSLLTMDMNISAPKRGLELDESKENCHPQLSDPVLVSVKMQKGGARIALYELCKKSRWPMPSFQSTEQNSSTRGTSGFNSFIASITLHIPGCTILRSMGDARPDKRSAQDSAALAILYELEKAGRCRIKEL